jgi:hypothetical protein
MSGQNVKSFEAAAFSAKLEKLAAPGTAIDDAAFADIVYTALSRFGIDETRFRDAFGLSSGAVERWTRMKNLPQPSVRPGIISWIREQL